MATTGRRGPGRPKHNPAAAVTSTGPVPAARPPSRAPTSLDNLTLSRKEGFRALVDAPDRVAPEQLSQTGLAALSDPARAAYDKSRRVWHANLGPIRTPQLAALHEDLWDIIDSNLQDGDQAKGAIAVDAFPGLGKTTAVLAFAKKFHRREIRADGEFTDGGHERWPVCRVGLTGNTGMKDFNRAILEFYGHPSRAAATTAQLGRHALDCVLSCNSRVLIIDDLHFLSWRSSNGVEISNHFKHIANEFPVTLLFVGVGLAARGLFTEGESYSDAVLAQTGRRTTRLGMEPFTISNEAGRRAWRDMLLAIEQRLVLADTRPGMVADDLADYLFARSTGHIGFLMTLVNRGAQRAMRTGAERLTIELLDAVKNDAAAELARRELQAALETGKLRATPKSKTQRRATAPKNAGPRPRLHLVEEP